MAPEHHDFRSELPEFEHEIHELKTNDYTFKKLYEQYNKLDATILRMEENLSAADDLHLEELKKERLHLKDELVELIKHYKQSSGDNS